MDAAARSLCLNRCVWHAAHVAGDAAGGAIRGPAVVGRSVLRSARAR